MSGEAVLSAENIGKLLGGRAPPRTPLEGAHTALPDPPAGGEGVAAPPQELHPRCRPFGRAPH